MKPYSEDLRLRIVKAIQVGGMSKSAAARLFSVSLSSVKRYTRLAALRPAEGFPALARAADCVGDRAEFEQPLPGTRGIDGAFVWSA